jgi:hypothetical protein
MKYTDILELLDKIDNDEEDQLKLERAVDYFCSSFDRCEGYKQALRQTIRDQYENHQNEQDPDDIIKLYNLLK